MRFITDWIGGLPGPLIYLIVAALVFAEDSLFFGFVLPAETSVVVAGFLAHQGRVDVTLLAVVVVAAAIVGDSVGYEVGRRLGPSILDAALLRRHADRVQAARELIRRRGPVAVFLGRFVAFFRAVMPALAGLSHMPYRRFLPFNALGGLLWGVAFTLLGYFAGATYTRVESLVGHGVDIAVAIVVLALLTIWALRHHRRRACTRRGRPD
ncbi:DedA family protein [Actinomadura rugatobispora]|uniref:DedA family protein n=1 Tax=Actinomadura rugatobispora TaxID=1994 RepID=A0ABW1A1Y5_9ACTN|nr:hypothetical protein GCM10010200_042570 [Actinomadura rugatobispora]